MIHLDTNVLIRFFTKDDLVKAVKAKKLLETEKHLAISDVVFPEIEYILSNKYNMSREELIEIFKFLASLSNIKLTHTIKKAVLFYEESSLDMADCIIASYALKGKLASFDRELLQVSGIEKYWH